MSDCCGHTHSETFEGLSPVYKRILIAVAILNFLMFAVEGLGGHLTQSSSLQADALDFLADALTYTISFWAIGKAAKLRATVALGKGISLLLISLYVLGTTLYHLLSGTLPEAVPMGAIGILACAVNVGSVLLLYKWRNGDANIRSVWLCSRNDAIGNVAVVAAAVLVAFTGTAWPDLIVALGMAGLFLSSSMQIIAHALKERRSLTA